jgi:cytochrome oxidase Cu insertion factor (SCO1/SenC/PrrC family)
VSSIEMVRQLWQSKFTGGCARPPAGSAARKGGWHLGLVLIALTAWGCRPTEEVRPRRAEPPLPVAGKVEVDEETAANIAATPFTLTDQAGEEFSSQALAGKVWMGAIFFSNCPGPCFRENQAIADILKEIDDPDFMVVSLTCDPVNDTPDVLRRYADRFAADPARWKFLTGDMKVISDVGLKAFKLPVEVGVHSERGVVFDRQGRLRGGYHLLQQDRVEVLKKLIREVLAEPTGATAPAGGGSGEPSP